MTGAETALRFSHASGLHAVNRALTEMHRDMLRLGGEEGATVRMSVLNIVAACVDVDDADLASRAVGRIGETHPARAIIVLADPDGEPRIEADLSLQCANVGSVQVCAEQVRLFVSGEAAYHLASVVTPLLIPDIPVHLWLIGAPPLEQAFGQDAVALCERLIIDSGAYPDAVATMRTLSTELASVGDGIALSDIAWERVQLWRQLIARCFDGERVRGFQRGIVQVDVQCSGDCPSAQAWLISGWLAARLGWPRGADGPVVRTSASIVDGVAAHDLASVTLHCRAAGHEAVVTVERRRDAIHTVIDVDGGITAESTVPLREIDAVDLVGQLLEGAGEDPVYRPSLERAAELAGQRA